MSSNASLETAAAEAIGTAGIVDVGQIPVVVASGGDRLAFLHRLLTAGVEHLTAGQGVRALLLNIKGHVVADLRLLVREADVLLLTPPGQGEAAATALARYAIMDDVSLAVQPDLGVLAVHGPDAALVLARAGVTVPAALATGPALAHAEVAGPGGPLTVVRSHAFASPGFDLVGPRAALAEVGAALGAAGVASVSAATAEALRIAAREAKFGTEITPEVFPMEVGLDAAIDYEKGCYLGQEPIVRIRDRGHLNRRLVGLRLSADAEVSAGDQLETEGRPKAGRVTSAARLASGPVALAIVHVGVPVGATVVLRHGDRSFNAEIVSAGASADARDP
jgi:folate-binding protein YgfZ